MLASSHHLGQILPTLSYRLVSPFNFFLIHSSGMQEPLHTGELSDLKGITFGGLNICSLKNKLDDIETILLRSDLDLLTLSETWLDNHTDNISLESDSYILF